MPGGRRAALDRVWIALYVVDNDAPRKLGHGEKAGKPGREPPSAGGQGEPAGMPEGMG